MTNVAWRTRAGASTMAPMELLAACGLLIGTVDYALLVRRRAALRRQWRESTRQANRALM